MHISVNLIEEPFVFEGKNEEGNKIFMDASTAIGGKGKGMRPMELLATSLAGCMSIDVLSILRKQRQTITLFEIKTEAIRSTGTPSPFEKIGLNFIVNKEVDLEKLQHAINLSHEKYCSVSASLANQIQITTTVQHAEL